MPVEVNRDAEINYIGCMLVDGELVKEATLQPKHLYHHDIRILFDTLKQIDEKNEPIDIVSIITTAGQEKVQAIGGKNRISEIMNSVVSTESFKTYEKYIMDAFKVREANRVRSKEINDPSAISNLIKDLSELEQESQDEDYDHRATIIELHHELETPHEGFTGINTGLRDYNTVTDGFQNGDLIISAARPSMGKTAKAIQHALSACELDNAIVPIFSLEMEKKKLLKRMYASVGRIDAFKLKNPVRFFDTDDWNRLMKAEAIVSNMDIEIYDKPGQTVPEIYARVRKIRRNNPDRKILVIIDYLQLIRSHGKFESKNQEVGEITRTLKEMAKDIGCPVYLLSQLSRGVESRQDKRPMMSDLRDSGSIEQDADIVEFLYRDDYYDAESENKNIIEIIIAKFRDGAVGTVEVAFLKEYNRFVDLDTRYSDEEVPEA